jgi:branched-chain amino acid transport system permease protein
VSTFVALTIVGLVSGCIYALTATGLVVTYTTAGVFNFAQGAMGMVAAFTFWQLWQGWELPLWLALVVVIGVLAPLFGLVVERVLFRRAAGAPPDQTLATTLALLLILLGFAYAVWPVREPRILPRYAGSGSLTFLGITLSATQLLIIASTLAIGVLLRLLFSRTRVGLAMRAVVDDPDLLAMNGLEPARVQQLAWALSSTLAAVSGVLLAPLVQLNILNLTLLVVNGYAAAMVGRLRSLPVTALGALGLGLAGSWSIGYLPDLSFVPQWFQATLQQGLPMLLLFVVLIVMRPDPLRAGAPRLHRPPRVPSARRAAVSGVGFVIAAAVFAGAAPSSWLDTGSRALVLAFCGLSLVLLTGYSGQVSLCTLSFVGIGAYAMGKVGGLGGVLVAVVVTALVGALVALPTLRLRGLYLALATFAFGEVVDIGYFGHYFGASGTLHVSRLPVPGGEAGYFVFAAAVFAAGSVALLAVRRSRFGRRLAAMDDSPAASATLGMRLARVKLGVFMVAAATAGLGGALFGGLGAGIVSSTDFATLQSCVLFLLLRIGGIKTVTGALLAAVVIAVLPVIQQQVPSLGGLAYAVTGLGALTLAYAPGGLGGFLADLPRLRLPSVRRVAHA